MADLSPFIVTVFCLIDDWLKGLGRLRARGPAPTLCDSEVLTIDIVGEFLGLDEDTELSAHFRRHYAHFFPDLLRVSLYYARLDASVRSGSGSSSNVGAPSLIRGLTRSLRDGWRCSSSPVATRSTKRQRCVSAVWISGVPAYESPGSCPPSSCLSRWSPYPLPAHGDTLDLLVTDAEVVPDAPLAVHVA